MKIKNSTLDKNIAIHVIGRPTINIHDIMMDNHDEIKVINLNEK